MVVTWDTPVPQCLALHVLPSVYEYPDVITEQLEEECKKGYMSGPFSAPPFQSFVSSDLGLVPKKDQSYRMIHHLSAVACYSVSDGID